MKQLMGSYNVLLLTFLIILIYAQISLRLCEQTETQLKVKTSFLLSVAAAGCVGNMASSDVHVRICEQELLKYDLEIKALIQVRTCVW